MVMEGDLTWGGEHTVQYTDDVLQSCISETYVILLTNATPVHSGKYTRAQRNGINYLIEQFCD